jgi:DNA-binding transcriptional LysR family regulator
MSKLPDLEGLAIFAKVAEARSFAGAAKELAISTATVSRAVGRLEERLGARLFNRTSRRLALTGFGRMIAERAGRVVTEAEEAEAIALDQSAKPRGLIRFAVPMSFGLRWVAPLLPEFFRQFPEVSVDLHLSDAVVDLIGDGFDAALRIAVLPDSSLVARRLCGVAPFIVAAPAYLAAYGCPIHPRDLREHHCLGYAYRPRQDIWRFTNAAGEEEVVHPKGPLRVTNADALVPTLLAGIGVAELPEFIVSEFLADGRLEAILTDWSLPSGAAHFVTPSAGPRPARVEVLADFLAKRLSRPTWRWPR